MAAASAAIRFRCGIVHTDSSHTCCRHLSTNGCVSPGPKYLPRGNVIVTSTFRPLAQTLSLQLELTAAQAKLQSGAAADGFTVSSPRQRRPSRLIFHRAVLPDCRPTLGPMKDVGARGNAVSVHGSSGRLANLSLGNASKRVYATKCLKEKEIGDREVDSHHEPTIADANKLLTLPTILTLGRLAAIPALLAVFFSTAWWSTSTGAAIFVLASLTDWLDGYFARKMNTCSAFGAFLDPVADKLMVATTLVLLCTRPLQTEWARTSPWLIPLPSVAIISREITMSAVREWAASQGGDVHKAVAVNNLGKWKTASQMVALTLLLLASDGRLDAGGWVSAAGVGLLYVAASLACWSLFVYFKAIWGSFLV